MLERFSAAKRAGFGAVEIQYPYDIPAADLKSAKELHDLDITVINVPSGLGDGVGVASIPGREDEFKRAVDCALPYADALRPNAVNIVAGAPPPDRFQRIHCMDLLATQAHYAAEAFQSIGVRTILEAINTRQRPNFLLGRTEDSVEIVRRAGHASLGIQFDIYHMHIMGEDLAATATRHLDLIGNIQFADTPDRHEPGTGSLDFATLFSDIEKAGWKGYFAAEYIPVGKTEDGLGWMQTFGS